MTEEIRDPGNIEAGEYVLGTLQGPAREAFDRRLREDAALRQEVAEWERQLAPLLETVEPIEPPVALRRKLMRRLGMQPDRSRGGGFWNSLNFWRGMSMVAAALVLVLGLALLLQTPQTDSLQQVMVVLNEQSQTGWLVGVKGRKEVLRVSAVQPTPLPADKVCQLWLQTEAGRMISLGVLPHQGSVEMPIPSPASGSNHFVVSIESAAAAPLAQPQGQIVFEGSLTPI